MVIEKLLISLDSETGSVSDPESKPKTKKLKINVKKPETRESCFSKELNYALKILNKKEETLTRKSIVRSRQSEMSFLSITDIGKKTQQQSPISQFSFSHKNIEMQDSIIDLERDDHISPRRQTRLFTHAIKPMKILLETAKEESLVAQKSKDFIFIFRHKVTSKAKI